MVRYVTANVRTGKSIPIARASRPTNMPPIPPMKTHVSQLDRSKSPQAQTTAISMRAKPTNRLCSMIPIALQRR